jgi:hypothetical protein
LYIAVSQDDTIFAFGNQDAILIAKVDQFFDQGEVLMKLKALGDEKIMSSVFFTHLNELLYYNDK